MRSHVTTNHDQSTKGANAKLGLNGCAKRQKPKIHGNEKIKYRKLEVNKWPLFKPGQSIPRLGIIAQTHYCELEGRQKASALTCFSFA